MKWLPFATGARISRVLIGLMVLALLKLTLLGVAGMDLWFADQESMPGVSVPQALAQEAPAGQAPGDNATEAEDAADQADGNETAQTDQGDEYVTDSAFTEEKPAGMDPSDWAALKKREAELIAKERSLKALEADLDAKLREMEALQAELDEMLKNAESIQDEKVKHLVDVYSNMKAKQAAAVLETLQPELAVKILAGMKGRQAGEILTNVEPVKAAKLSEMLTKMQIPFGEQ